MQLVKQRPDSSVAVQGGRSAFTTSQPLVHRDETRCAPGAPVEIYLDQFRSTYLPTFYFVMNVLCGSGGTGMQAVYRIHNQAPHGCSSDMFTSQTCLFWLLPLKLLFAFH